MALELSGKLVNFGTHVLELAQQQERHCAILVYSLLCFCLEYAVREAKSGFRYVDKTNIQFENFKLVDSFKKSLIEFSNI